MLYFSDIKIDLFKSTFKRIILDSSLLISAIFTMRKLQTLAHGSCNSYKEKITNYQLQFLHIIIVNSLITHNYSNSQSPKRKELLC